MRAILLLSLTLVMNLPAFAQASSVGQHPVQLPAGYSSPLSKTTGHTDTAYGKDPTNHSALTYYYYYNDSGYLYGTNLLGNKGYAQRYDFNGADSSLEVWGVVAYFAGRYTTNTTKTATFKCWSVGPRSAPVSTRPHFLNAGAPASVMAQTSPYLIKDIGINPTTPSLDTPKVYYFSTPTTPATTSSFFVGFELAYTPTALNGDTVTVIVDANGNRTLPEFTISGADTVYNNWNAIEAINSTWFDGAYASGGILNNYFLYPLLISHSAIGVKGVTRNNLTWYGNYPNPARDYTNIKFSLNTTADITVDIMDMSGRKIDVIAQRGMEAGTHQVTCNTSRLPAGNYMYVIHTNTGDGMSSILSVVK